MCGFAPRLRVCARRNGKSQRCADVRATPKKVTRLVLENVETLRGNGILVKTYRSNGKRLISLRSAESADLPTVGKIDPIDPASRSSACTAP